MKNLLGRLIVPAVLTASILSATSAFAAGEWRSDHPTQLILTEPTAIYNHSFDDPSQKIAELAPQTVTVTGAYLPKGYEIETWLGKKWIFATDVTKAIPHEPQYAPKKFQLLLAYMPLYKFPSDNGWTEAGIGPQVVEVVDAANGYYKINTWLGERWIKAPSAAYSNAMIELSQIQQVDEKINIPAAMNLYTGPTHAAETSNVIAPQTVKAFEKIGKWYHIKSSWPGAAWVNVGGVPWADVEPTKDDEVINLTKETEFFSIPVDGGAWGRLAPQQVHAFEKWEDFYHIHAWLGDIWIKR